MSSLKLDDYRGKKETVDRTIVPNHSLETEQALVSIALNDFEITSLCSTDDFFIEDNRVIWQTIIDLENDGQKIDPVIISNRIIETKNKNLFEYIAKLSSLNTPNENADAYAKEIKRYAFNRKLENLSKEAKNLSALDGDPFLKIAMAQSLLDKLTENIEDNNDPIHIGKSAHEAAIEIEKSASNGSTGLLTGFTGVDNICNGLMSGEMIIIGGRPAMGKTSFAVNIAEHVAERMNENDLTLKDVHEKPEAVLIFSLEMGDRELSKRVIASRANIDAKQMRAAKLDDYEWEKVGKVVGDLSKVNILIDDKAGVGISYMRSVIRKLSRKYKIRLVIIDYLQLIKGTTGRPYDDVSENSRSIKQMAKDFEFPVIALSQLSRDVEKRADKRPMNSDLRESGAIEQDADIIMFVYRDDVYHIDTPFPGMAEIIITKHRSGSTGTAMLSFISSATRFENPGPDFELTIMG